MVAAWECRNRRQVVSVLRFGAGGIRSALRTRRTVDALARWPGLSSSPRIRWYPQPLFPVASRSISAVISALTGGRPVRSGQVRFRVTRRRRHRSTVPGVTSRCSRSLLGRRRISAAGTARSAQSSRGRGLMRRRTATSCRSASSSAFFDADERPSRTSQSQMRMKIR